METSYEDLFNYYKLKTTLEAKKSQLDSFRSMPESLYKRFITLYELIDNSFESKPTYRAGLNHLFDFVMKETDYLNCPASTKYHLAVPNGLLIHSMNVAENALKIGRMFNKELTTEIPEWKFVFAGLFHDLGKAGWPKLPHYIKNEPTEKQKRYGYSPKYPYSFAEDTGIYMTVPQQAVYLVTKFMDIEMDVYLAILTHDGQYVPENQAYAGKEIPLQLILHYADSWAGFVQEKRVFGGNI